MCLLGCPSCWPEITTVREVSATALTKFGSYSIIGLDYDIACNVLSFSQWWWVARSKEKCFTPLCTPLSLLRSLVRWCRTYDWPVFLYSGPFSEYSGWADGDRQNSLTWIFGCGFRIFCLKNWGDGQLVNETTFNWWWPRRYFPKIKMDI